MSSFVAEIRNHGLHQEQTRPESRGSRIPEGTHSLRREHHQRVVQGLQTGLSQRPTNAGQVRRYVQDVLSLGQRRAIL